jgi:hypothetical protein
LLGKLDLKSKAVMLFVILLAFTFTTQAANIKVYAASVTITTTLTDGAVQKGSRKTFDVIARDSSGKKIASSVTLNGAAVKANWDDEDKTSYTLNLTKEGTNLIGVSAGGATKTYTITYQKANPGDVIGKAVWSVELFTIGCDYLIEPVYFDIKEGETSATQLLRLLHQYGYVGLYGGTPDKAFYLAYVGDGNKTNKFQGRTNSSTLLGSPSSPKNLNLNPKIPSYLYAPLQESTTFFDNKDYANWTGYMGEFVFTNGSGWMYCVNNVFPNVGFADSFLSDGDVVRVQFTLCYGADIGGSGAMGGSSISGSDFKGGDFYAAANKDRLTALAASAAASGKKSLPAYTSVMSVLKTANATQSQVDNAYTALSAALNQTPANTDPSSPSTSTPGTSTPGTSKPGTSTPGTSTPGTNTPTLSDPSTLPPGSTVSQMPDGSIVASTPNGNVITEKPDGTVIIKKPGGTTVTETPDGTVITEMADGTVITENADGTVDVQSGSEGNVLFDKTTKILISGAPDSSKIRVRTPEKQDSPALFSELTNLGEKFWVYDIDLLNENGEKIQPGQKVSVRIPLPEGIGKDVKLYRSDDETGALIPLEFRIEDDMVIFETENFSIFSIVDVTTDNQTDADLSTNMWWIIVIIAVVVVAGGGFILYVKIIRPKKRVEE